jgi:hypothetical protein
MAHAACIVKRSKTIMIRSLNSTQYEALIRQAHAERARYMSMLLHRGLQAVEHGIVRSAHALLDVVEVFSDAGYLGHASNHTELRRRVRVLEREHAQASAGLAHDVGH